MASYREQWAARTGKPKEQFPKGLSEREQWSLATGKPKEQFDGGGSKSDSKSKSGSASSLVKDISKAILDVTPAEKDPYTPFDYTPALEAEDQAQAEALFNPFYEEQVANLLEDLDNVEQMESVNYQRTLRRARFSMASGGGAIGTERETNDQEITDNYTYNKNNRAKEAERTVGTERLTGAGFSSVTNSPQEGSLIRDWKANIADQKLRSKEQRQQRWAFDADQYYKIPSTKSVTGKNL